MRLFQILSLFVFSCIPIAKSEEQPNIAAEMSASATEAVADAKANYNVDLDFSMKSLAAVEDILTKKINPLPLDELASKEIEESMRYGAYIGETLRRVHKNLRWLRNHPDQPGGSPTVVVGDIYIFPVSWVLKRIHFGRDGDKIAPKIEAFTTALDTQTKQSEQYGTGQPATRPDSKSEGSDKPQPEAEGRSR